MTTYAYTGAGAYIQGLPAENLDTADLTAAQLVLLTEALAAGIYEVSATTKTIRPTSIDPPEE